MTPEEIRKQNERDARYWKLGAGDKLKGKFTSNDFKREEGKGNDGSIFVKYSASFVGQRNGGDQMQKLYSCSGQQVGRFMDICLDQGKNFLDAIWIISKKGEGMGSKYEIQLFSGPIFSGQTANPATEARRNVGVVDSSEPMTDEVPF